MLPLFANSGAEANEGQIKLARKYAVDHGHPERYVVISMLKSFHGRTLATATATGQEIVHNPKWYSPLPEGFRYAESRTCLTIFTHVTSQRKSAAP